MRNFKTLAFGALSFLAGIVVLQNTESVDTEILVWTITMPRAAMLFVVLLLGFVLGLLLGYKGAKRV